MSSAALSTPVAAGLRKSIHGVGRSGLEVGPETALLIVRDPFRSAIHLHVTCIVPGTVLHDDDVAELSDEDRLLAEAQGFCAVTAEPLGSMGPPLKLIVNDQPVFVCCKGCEKKAKSNPDKTLARVAELKTKVKSESHN